MTSKEIRNRLIGGEPFTIFNYTYHIAGVMRDGLYDYKLRNERGHHVGAARFTGMNNSVLLAFTYGRFTVPLKDFEYGS